MSVRTDVINLSVNINGNDALNKLNELRKKSAEVSVELKGLVKGTKEYVEKSRELDTVKEEMSNLKKTIGLTSLSLKELRSDLAKLKSLQGSVAPLSKEFFDYEKKIKAVIDRQKELTAGINGYNSQTKKSFSEAGSSIRGVLASYLGFQAAIAGIGKIFTGAIKASDQLADLRRVAGLTKDEANNLNTSLLKLDTRTSGEGLRNIAIVAGKLGVAKQDILSFTAATDKLVVTLGDELGDADQVTSQLGKILNVFDGKVTGQNLSYLGNAFVELANKGVATGGFIADFTQRVSGIAKASNLSLGSTVGLAAGFEELGLRSESSSTALQKLLSTIAGNLPKAAKIANLSIEDLRKNGVKSFEELFAKKPQEALIKYAEGLVKNKQSFAEITAGFKDAGEEGARVVQTLQAIGQKGDFLREKIDLGSDAIKRQTALDEGFALKNDNLAGSIEKLGKGFDKLIASKGINTFLKTLADDFNSLFKSIQQISDDTLDVAFDKATKGIGIWLFKGTEALKAYQKEQEKLRDFKGQIGKQGVEDSKSNNIFVLPEDGPKIRDAKFNAASPITDPDAKKNADKAAKDASHEREESLKRAEEFHKKQLELIAKANLEEAQSLKAKYKDEANDENKTLEERFAALKLYYEAGIKLIKQNREDEQKILDNEIKEANKKAATPQEKKEITGYKNQKQIELNNKAALDSAKFETEVSDAFTKVAEDNFKKLSAAGKLAYEDLKKASDDAYKHQTDAIQIQTNDKLIQLDKDFQNGKIKHLKDFQKQHDDIIKDGKQSELEYEIASLEIFDKILKAQGIVDKDLALKISNARKELEDNKANDKGSDDKNKQEKLVEKIDAGEKAAAAAVSVAQRIDDNLAQLEQRALNRELRKNNIIKAGYQKLLDTHLISQKRYNNLAAKADEDLDKKKHSIELKAFKRQQALSIVNALINGAQAVTRIWADVPKVDFGIATAILTGISIATTAAEIAIIASQKPPEAAKGGIFKGPSHSEGGMTVYDNRTGKPTVEVEGGEPFLVLSKNTLKNNGAIISSLLDTSLNKNGAQIKPWWLRQQSPHINLARVLPILASGGVVNQRSISSFDTTQSYKQDQAENKKFTQEQTNQITEALNNFNGRINAVVSLKDFKDKQTLLDKAKAASGIRTS